MSQVNHNFHHQFDNSSHLFQFFQYLLNCYVKFVTIEIYEIQGHFSRDVLVFIAVVTNNTYNVVHRVVEIGQ